VPRPRRQVDLARTASKRSVLLPALCWLGLGACGGDTIVAPEELEIPIEDVLDGPVVVTENPNGVTPLAAKATFRTKSPVAVTVSVLGPEPLVHELPEATTEHTIAILGLYPGTRNRVELRLADPGRFHAVDTLEISTDALPEFFPTVEIVAAARSQMEPGWTLSSLSIGDNGVFRSQPMMFDSNGDVRWYMDLSFLPGIVYMVERFANGNLLFGHAQSIYEYDMLGKEIRRWDLPGYGYHHDVVEKPDGNLLVAVRKLDLSTTDDHVIEVDRSSGGIVNEWDLRQVLDVYRRDLVDDDVDWFHMNAVWYSAVDDALIISGRNQATVKVTRDNELVWILAPHRGWGKAGPAADGHETSEFLLTAVDSDGDPYPDPVQQGDETVPGFDWPWGQHAPMILPDGNLFLFDNGLTRNFSAEGPTYSRGVEYVIDESRMTVRQVWQYGEERGPDFYSVIISDVDLLSATGNRLIMPGVVFGADPHAFVTEVSYPDGNVVFEARLHFKNLLSSGALSWGNLDLVYRSERLPPYPE
jgi:arylsulfate sulfotransferase